MESLILRGTNVKATRLGFGCARLMRMQRHKDRKNVIAAALDAGITYFDVAPMYGMGVAEAELARCLGNRRHDVTIATKFGLEARSGVLASSRIQGIARRVLNMMPAVKKLIQRNAGMLVKPGMYDVESGKASLQNSLARLGVEHIGVLLMHEPAIGDLTDSGLLAWFESLRDDGLIGAWGVAGEAPVTAAVASAYPELVPVMQFDCDALNRQIESMPDVATRALLTYSPMVDLFQRIQSWLSADYNRAKEWSAVTGSDFSNTNTIAKFLLGYAIRANSSGVVLYSTSSPQRIVQSAAWVEDDDLTESEIAVFCSLLDKIPPFAG